jgi:hypothetical protein
MLISGAGLSLYGGRFASVGGFRVLAALGGRAGATDRNQGFYPSVG